MRKVILVSSNFCYSKYCFTFPTYDRAVVSTLFSDPRGGQVVYRRMAVSMTSVEWDQTLWRSAQQILLIIVIKY